MYQINAMAMYFDPKVLYEHDLIYSFINFNENFRNGNKKVNKVFIMSRKIINDHS